MTHRYRCKVPAGAFCAAKRAKIRQTQRALIKSGRVFVRPAVHFVRQEVEVQRKATEALAACEGKIVFCVESK
jgi:hypothetical protein